MDYFCTGPCWPTPTEPGRPAPGLDLVRAATADKPEKEWFAIGGIDLQRLPQVLAAGRSAWWSSGQSPIVLTPALPLANSRAP